MNIRRTKKLTTIGMLCALAYVTVMVGRIPLVLFLKYDHIGVLLVALLMIITCVLLILSFNNLI